MSEDNYIGLVLNRGIPFAKPGRDTQPNEITCISDSPTISCFFYGNSEGFTNPADITRVSQQNIFIIYSSTDQPGPVEISIPVRTHVTYDTGDMKTTLDNSELFILELGLFEGSLNRNDFIIKNIFQSESVSEKFLNTPAKDLSSVQVDYTLTGSSLIMNRTATVLKINLKNEPVVDSTNNGFQDIGAAIVICSYWKMESGDFEMSLANRVGEECMSFSYKLYEDINI